MFLATMVVIDLMQSVGPPPPTPGAGQQRPFVRALTPRDQQKWVMLDDYPTEALDGRAFGRARFRLSVDASGRVTDCHILVTSGYWVLDEQTCIVLKRRARFLPALDGAGNPAPATYTSVFTWDRGDQSTRQWKALMERVSVPVAVEVVVKRLPADYGDSALARVRFDAGKKPVECRVEVSSGSLAADRAACTQVMASAQPVDGSSFLGQPDTRMFVVSFKASAIE
jgi:TonB family protein